MEGSLFDGSSLYSVHEVGIGFCPYSPVRQVWCRPFSLCDSKGTEQVSIQVRKQVSMQVSMQVRKQVSMQVIMQVRKQVSMQVSLLSNLAFLRDWLGFKSKW